MALPDKFGVIIGNEHHNNEVTSTELKCYFENLIKNNNKIFLSTYVHDNIKLLPSDEVQKIIFDNLTDYIKEIRKNLRLRLRRSKDSFLIDSLISIVNNFSHKIYDLEYFYDTKKNTTESYNQLFSTIICDPIIKEVFKKDTMIEKNYRTIKYLFSKINRLDKDFYNNWCIPFIETCLQNYGTSITRNFIEYPIPKNLVPIYQFHELSNFLEKYNKHFNFITEKNIYESICRDLLGLIFEISSKNIIENFTVFIEENKNVIHKIFKILDNNDKENFETKFIVEITDKYMKQVELESLCKLFISFSKNYSVLFPSSTVIFCKGIALWISNEDKFSELNDILFRFLGLDEDVTFLFSIISYFDDKNIIFKRYHQELMLRLLDNKITEQYIAYEKMLVSKLTKCFNTKQIYKLSKTIDDVDKSGTCNNYVRQLLRDQKQDNYLSNDWNIINTSYNTWDTTVFDTATRLDETESDGTISKFFKFYSNIYQKTHNSTRYLNWYLHTGTISMNYKSNKGLIQLKMLPLQAMVLERFDGNDFILMNDFMEFDFISSYDRKEKEKILDVFIKSEILYLEQDKIILNLNKTSDTLDLITKFFEVSSLPSKWKEIEEEDIANNKEDIIKTKINHHVKIQSYSFDELYEKCREINTFQVDMEMFKKAIEYMVKMEYIKSDDETHQYSKLLY